MLGHASGWPGQIKHGWVFNSRAWKHAGLGMMLTTDEMALDKLQNPLSICFLIYNMEIMSLPPHKKFIRLFLLVSISANWWHNESRSMERKHNWIQELRPLVPTANIIFLCVRNFLSTSHALHTEYNNPMKIIILIFIL